MKRQLQRLTILILLIGIIQTFCHREQNFQFAWISDTHIGAATANVDLISIVNDINSQREIDFILITGDITEMGSNNELALAKSILDSLKKPYFILPGNHDTKWSESGCTKFKELWGFERINFEYDGIRFIGIHQGPIMRMGDGLFAPEDLRWLDTELKKISPTQPLFFVTHYPLDESISNWYEVLDRLKKYNTQVVLIGHGHRNMVKNFEGVPGIMGRSALRGKNEIGGYNIVSIQKDSFQFFEKIPGKKINFIWHGFRIVPRQFEADTTHYQRPDFSVNNQYPDITCKWNFNTYYTIACAPAVWEDYVVVGNSNGTVFCLYVEDGRQIWRFDTGKSVFSTPDVDSGKVVFGSSDGYIYCLDVVEGDLIWKFKTDAPIVAAPEIYDSIVYVGSSDFKFRAINLNSGELVWQYDQIKKFVETKPLIYKDKVIFGAWDTYLYALNRKDGTLAWKWSNDNPGKLYSPAVCCPVASFNKIFIVAPDRYMTAIDFDSGKTIWRSNRYMVRECIGISEDQKTIYAKTMQDTVIACFSWETEPQMKWIVHAGFGYDIDPSMLIEKDGVLYFGTQHGFIYAMDAENGNLNWRYRVGVAQIHTVVPVNDFQVVATDMDGRIFLVQKEGSELESIP